MKRITIQFDGKGKKRINSEGKEEKEKKKANEAQLFIPARPRWSVSFLRDVFNLNHVVSHCLRPRRKEEEVMVSTV